MNHIIIIMIQMADEEKFERTIAILGRLLRDDLQLQVKQLGLVIFIAYSVTDTKPFFELRN